MLRCFHINVFRKNDRIIFFWSIELNFNETINNTFFDVMIPFIVMSSPYLRKRIFIQKNSSYIVCFNHNRKIYLQSNKEKELDLLGCLRLLDTSLQNLKGLLLFAILNATIQEQSGVNHKSSNTNSCFWITNPI
jgi:hypothetical protein